MTQQRCGGGGKLAYCKIETFFFFRVFFFTSLEVANPDIVALFLRNKEIRKLFQRQTKEMPLYPRYFLMSKTFPNFHTVNFCHFLAKSLPRIIRHVPVCVSSETALSTVQNL